MKQKVKIIDHDANRAKMMRLLHQPEKALRINHSAYRFAITTHRHYDHRRINNEAISKLSQYIVFYTTSELFA